MSSARTFDSATQSRGIFQHLGQLLDYPSNIWRNRYMVQNFFRRDLMSRFHGSFLGAWWMLVQPLIMFSVYFLVFGIMFDRTGDGPSVKFALYLFSGVIVFHSLIEATSTCCNIIVSNGNLVKKVAFPSEALPIHVGMIAVVIYSIGAIVCLTAAIATGLFVPTLSTLMLPLFVVVLFVMVIGIGLLLANANVFVRDVQQLWRIFTQVWMFLSPVFWKPAEMFGAIPNGPLPTILIYGNPAYSLIMAQRIAICGENVEWGVTDFWGHLGIAATWAIGFLLVGFTTFVANKRKHADIV